MQQGMLSSLLLSLSLLTLPVAVSAKEMQESVVEQWLQDTQIQTKVSELLEYVVRDEVDSLKFSLDRLAFPQQEWCVFACWKKIRTAKHHTYPAHGTVRGIASSFDTNVSNVGARRWL